jgi:hypothetical protein
MKKSCECVKRDKLLNILAMPLVGLLACYIFLLMYIAIIKNKFL